MTHYGFLRPSGDEVTVAEVLAAKGDAIPKLVHVHPNEPVRDAIDILREFGVSQMPVVKAEPPLVTAEVVGSIVERDLLDALFTGRAQLRDPVSQHMSPPLPTIGGGQPVGDAVALLTEAGAALVLIDGNPGGVIGRQDLLAYLGTGRRRKPG
jgi:cystathionine beta-synthase